MNLNKISLTQKYNPYYEGLNTHTSNRQTGNANIHNIMTFHIYPNRRRFKLIHT